MKRVNLLLALACLFLAIPCFARIITVDDDGPADFNNIQAAIDDANNGDTVLVSDGIYTGSGNRDINFNGLAITVRSENGPVNCIIDCNGTAAEPHRGFIFNSGEDANSIISGLTITNGYIEEYLVDGGGGGAIFCDNSSPTIINCIIKENTVQVDDWGCFDCSILADPGGGGISCYESSAKIINCIFYGNVATRPVYGGGVGGAFVSENSQNDNPPEIINCTFVDNYAGLYCGAICSLRNSALVTNSIIWGNYPTNDPGVGAWDFGPFGSGGAMDCRVDFSVV